MKPTLKVRGRNGYEAYKRTFHSDKWGQLTEINTVQCNTI